MGSRSGQRVAIIGAGLAGLSAAYELRDRVSVTIFERENRPGGRVLTSKQPHGEHGAEFFLGSERRLRSLLRELSVEYEEEDKNPAYLIGKKVACGYTQEIVRKLLPAQAARLQHIFKLACTNDPPLLDASFDQWLRRKTKGDQRSIQFVQMLLAGETCAPMSCIKAQYGLGCLQSVVDEKERWFRIKGGTDCLTNALARQLGRRIRLGTHVIRVVPGQDRVKVHWRAGNRDTSRLFDAAIITTPDGERLLDMPPHTNFHAYISVLMRCRKISWKTGGVDFKSGLYTSSPLGYIQEVQNNLGGFRVMRILMPNADLMMPWREKQIADVCVNELRWIGMTIKAPRCFIRKWKFGLPCGGSKKPYRKVCSRVYLAGDRFGKWPSMDAAVMSGRSAANAVFTQLKRLS